MSDIKEIAKQHLSDPALNGNSELITDLLAELERAEKEHNSAMREASSLAKWLHKKYYTEESPDFRLCDTPAGVMTQIDNMITGIPDIERQQAAMECIEIAEGLVHSPECVDEWSVTRSGAFITYADAIKSHFKLQEAAE